jgi:hypothetical protein
VNWKVAAAAAAIPDVAEDDPLQIKVCGFDWVLPVLDHSRGKSDSNRSQLRKAVVFLQTEGERNHSSAESLGGNPQIQRTQKLWRHVRKLNLHRLPTAMLGQQRSRMGHMTCIDMPFPVWENMGEAPGNFWKVPSFDDR